MADKDISPKPTPSKRGESKAKGAESGSPAGDDHRTDAAGPESPIAGSPAPLDSVSNAVKLGIIGVLTLAIAAAVIVFAVAGGDDGGSGGDAYACEVGEDRSEKPEVEVPAGDPPENLVTEDLVEGEGEEAQPGGQICVEYVGVTYEGGNEFDASYGQPDPFEFQLGGGQVIQGWDEGIAGMKVGGVRQLVIPPEQAYGAQGRPPDIGRNEVLVFVVELLDVNASGPPPPPAPVPGAPPGTP